MSHQNKVFLSVVINTKNAAKTLERTLRSVKFADEVIVVDALSTDNTMALAYKYTNKVFSYKKQINYVEPIRNFAIAKATGDWILIIDADEECPQKLRETLEKIIDLDKKGGKTADAYYLPRKNLIFNKWIQKAGWWPDMILRFFKKGAVQWSDKIHSIPLTKGEVVELPAKEELAIIHHNYQQIDQYLNKLINYTSIQSREMLTDLNNKKMSVLIFNKFYREFLSRFFANRGVDEGVHGLSLSLLQALSEAVVGMKVWETNGFVKEDLKDSKELIKSVHSFNRELSYWLADWQVEHSSGLKRLFWQLRRKFRF